MIIRFSTVLWVLLSFNILMTEISTAAPAAANKNKQLKQDIQTLDSRLNSEQKKASAIRNELRLLEKNLGKQDRQSYALTRKIKKVGKRLEKTKAEKIELDLELELQKKGLSQQMQALYSAGEQSHLRMLLKQDDPSDISRTIKYFEYLNKSRIKKISRVTMTLQKLVKAEADIINDKSELQRLSSDLSIKKKSSKKILKQRTLAYNKVKKSVNYKKRQLGELKRKEAKLQATIDRLIRKNQQKIEEQQQRNKAQQRKKAVAETQKKAIKKKSASSSQTKRTKKEKSVKQVGINQNFTSNRNFSTLRGKLSWPVRGKMIHSYGQRRNEKQRWKGVVIATAGGKKVQAVARGKVEFAGWFNGYGYLVIIRHDNNYRSLYGYNRAVYVRTGQIVKGGTAIAAVGNSGGQQRNALYFEIRKRSSPRNPAKWCR